MRFQFQDSAELIDGGLRETASGFLVGTARVARAGNIQIYGGDEVGRPDLRAVRVYRPAEEVFSRDTMRSVAHQPITLDHPSEAVDSGNWRAHARGHMGDEVARDGDFIRVPLVLMDSGAIGEYQRGKRELSLGYTCDLKWEPGKTADGKEYDAVQSNIRVNHLAIVGAARGGPELKLGDREDSEMTVENKRTVTIDGIGYTLTDQGAQLVENLQRKVTDAQAATTAAETKATEAATKLADALKQVATLEAEKATLAAQLSDATKPDALAKAAKDAAELRDTAKKLAPSLNLDGKSVAEVHKAVVDHKLGDAAAKFTADQYAASFATFAKGVTAGDGGLGVALGGAMPTGDAVGQRQKAIADRNQRLQNAWKQPQGAA